MIVLFAMNRDMVLVYSVSVIFVLIALNNIYKYDLNILYLKKL